MARASWLMSDALDFLLDRFGKAVPCHAGSVISTRPLALRGVEVLCHHLEYLLNFREELALLVGDLAKSLRHLLRVVA
jgi:hypothetical protein